MKKKIEFEVEVPEGIDEEFVELIPYLSHEQTEVLRGIIIGMLMCSDSISHEQLVAIDRKHRERRKSGNP